MRIAVIGTGHIGGTLGARWRAAGHDVVYGSRQGTGEGPGGAPLAPIGYAVQDADVVVLAIPGGAVAGTVGEYGAVLRRCRRRSSRCPARHGCRPPPWPRRSGTTGG
jgi:8-hydroxy-5-deazaflavin:NADPH oxidoreductase